MAAVLISQQGHPRFGSSCSACGVDFNRLTVHGSNTCLKCHREFCASCYSIKQKLDDLSSDASRSNRTCGTCEQLVTMKRECSSNVETFQGERPDRSDMSPKETLHKPALPVKPPRVAQGKLQNVGNDVHESHRNSGGPKTDFQAYNMSGSDREKLAMPSAFIAQHMTEPDLVSSKRFRGKRNQRGLCSKSDVPNVTDNRYYFLNRQERNPGENLTTNGTARNFYIGATFQNRTVPQGLPQELKSSKMNREHQMFPKGAHSYEWDDEFEQGMYNEGTWDMHHRNDPVFYNANAFGQEEAARRQERNLQNRAIHSEQGVTNWGTEKNPPRNDQSFDNTTTSVQKDARRSDWHSHNSQNQSEQGMTHWSADNFPQNSQFHKETITYPRSTEGYPFTSHRQSPHTYRSFREPNNSYDSRDQNYSYRYDKPTSSSRSSHNSWRSGRPTSQFDNDGFYDDPYVDDLEEFDDLDDVPAYDDIPYALIMTGSVDVKTLRRAKRKQMQLMELDLIKGKAGKSKAGEKVNKNKNQGNFATKKSSETRIDTYKEQLLSGRTKHTAEVLQSPGRKNGESNDAASSFGNELGRNNGESNDAASYFSNELSQKESIYPGNSNAHKTVKENGGNGTSRPLDEEIIPTRAENTELDNAMKTAMKTNYNETDDFEKRERHIERSQSPVHVSDKQEDTSRAASSAIKSDMDLVIKEENKSVNECHEKQRLETEKERYIREKRLEKLKAKEFSNLDKATEISHTHKPDNREVAFHYDIVHKPVKSTAFRSKVPNFRSDTAQQEKTIAASEASACDIKPGDTTVSKTKSSTSTSNITSDFKSDEQPLAMKFVQKRAESKGKSLHQNTTKLSGDKQNNSVNVTTSQGTSEVSSTYEAECDKENSDEETEPTAMKLLRQGKMKRSGHFRKTASLVHDDDNDEEMIEPSAMRLLRQSNGRSKTKEIKEGGLSQTSFSNTSGIPSSILATLTVMLGSKPGESMKGKTGSALIISNGISSAAKPKQVKKSKNKNMSPLVQKGQKSSAREEEPVKDTESRFLFVFGDDEQSDDVKGTDDKSSQSASVSGVTSMQTYTMQPVTIFKVADKRHKAFQKMKMSQSADYLKCTSCGRPECQGHNIKKMKEIIRIAKQAGFEVRDVTPDGNCMFAAVVDQLQLYGDYSFGPKSLREASVSWLIEHPYSDDGTHYSSFLSEDWEVYLQRMMAEGEWGDHLILRAIMETIGHTIKVLNVSGEESHWTILEPGRIDVSKDGMHLVLGHVGEFHYTSLRPTDGESSSFVPAPLSPTSQGLPITDEDGQIALEGTETVEMFREDYIDAWSDMPSVHFSYLLRNVIPIKVVNTAAIVQSQVTDNLSGRGDLKMMDSSSGHDIEYGGSLMEGVYVPHLNATINADSSVSDTVDVNIYEMRKDLVIVEQKSEVLGSEVKECVIDTVGVHIGFTKLLRIHRFSDGQEEYSQYQRHLEISEQPQDESGFHQFCNHSHIHCKRFSALRCSVWPECAKSWVSRVRREGWPSKEIISSIESGGCLLLPYAHNESKCPDLEWQFSFTLCEKKLFSDASSVYQKYCYILFEALCTQTMCHLQSISSAHLKSVFFYACERIPAEFWESIPGACVLYMLDELLRYIRTKNLPNYFINANNMVDHLKEKDFYDIEEQIILLRSQPVLFLRQINESLGMLPHGNTIIDKVSDDIPNFKAHKSLKMSTLEVFIPATIDAAQFYIRSCCFEEGYELLSQAFQQRLSVSTCDDSVPFQIFLQGAVSGLDLDSLVWFSAFTDKHLEGQLSKSLVRETCGDLRLVRIKDILPVDVVGSYGNTEVPFEFSTRICSFCHDFAKFLYTSNKLSEILPILYHCHGIFVKKLENAKSQQAANDIKCDQPTNEDFTDEEMFDIYTAMYTVYRKQQQIEFFRAVMPVVHAMVERINTRWAYHCICHMYQDLGDQMKLVASANVYKQLPEDPMEQTRVAAFKYWPNKVKLASLQ